MGAGELGSGAGGATVALGSGAGGAAVALGSGLVGVAVVVGVDGVGDVVACGLIVGVGDADGIGVRLGGSAVVCDGADGRGDG